MLITGVLLCMIYIDLVEIICIEITSISTDKVDDCP
jgi:hypothetical protein